MRALKLPVAAVVSGLLELVQKILRSPFHAGLPVWHFVEDGLEVDLSTARALVQYRNAVAALDAQVRRDTSLQRLQGASYLDVGDGLVMVPQD